MKKCPKCNIEKSLDCFGLYYLKNRDHRHRSWCKLCTRAADKRTPGYAARRAARYERQRDANRRAIDAGNTIAISRQICRDAKKSDKKKGRFGFDLDVDFINSLIQQPCTYCGDTEIRMTLDRINNDEGHTRANVVSSWIRCNTTRGNMPHEAWITVAQGMRKARETGQFGNWIGTLPYGTGSRRRKKRVEPS